MRDNILIKVALGVSILLLAVGCKTKREVTGPGTGREENISRSARAAVVSGVEKNQLTYTTFSGRARSNVRLNKSSYDVTTNIRIKRGEAIWASVTYLLGVEVARVLITPDSVHVMNRLQSEYIKKPFDYIYRYTSREMDFENLENLLTGNVLTQATDDQVTVTKNEIGHLLRGERDDLAYLIQVNPNFKPVATTVDEAARSQLLRAIYDAFTSAGGQKVFPQHININVSAPDVDLAVDMQYNRISFDDAVEFPFSPPARFKVVE